MNYNDTEISIAITIFIIINFLILLILDNFEAQKDLAKIETKFNLTNSTYLCNKLYSSEWGDRIRVFYFVKNDKINRNKKRIDIHVYDLVDKDKKIYCLSSDCKKEYKSIIDKSQKIGGFLCYHPK